MRSKHILILLLFLSLSVVAQQKEVEVTTEEVGSALLFKAKNNTSSPQLVTIRLDKFEGLKDAKVPRAKMVPAGKETVVRKVVIAAESYTYTYNYDWKIPPSVMKKKERQRLAALQALEKEQSIQYSDGYDLETGIVVFNNETCPRCNRTTAFMLEHQIPFVLLNMDNKENRALLREQLRKNNISGTFVTPVILVDGKLSHSHEDLMSFLRTLLKD